MSLRINGSINGLNLLKTCCSMNSCEQVERSENKSDYKVSFGLAKYSCNVVYKSEFYIYSIVIINIYNKFIIFKL